MTRRRGAAVALRARQTAKRSQRLALRLLVSHLKVEGRRDATLAWLNTATIEYVFTGFVGGLSSQFDMGIRVSKGRERKVFAVADWANALETTEDIGVWIEFVKHWLE
ncbi:hypothetical protein F5B20DRAFT_585139 [Whalleya microplaca]|nr:hypothetical protein F5B20DRAFT_585139 [Whalleya microplaca]